MIEFFFTTLKSTKLHIKVFSLTFFTCINKTFQHKKKQKLSSIKNLKYLNVNLSE